MGCGAEGFMNNSGIDFLSLKQVSQLGNANNF
jgi:hypothetical protein